MPRRSKSFGGETEHPGEMLEKTIYLKLTPTMWALIVERGRERGFRTGQDYIRFLIYADANDRMMYLDEALHTFAIWIGDTIGASAGRIIFESEKAFIEQDTTAEKSKHIRRDKGKPRKPMDKSLTLSPVEESE